MRVSMSVNGISHEREVEPRMLLADFLRDELGRMSRRLLMSLGAVFPLVMQRSAPSQYRMTM